jgi:hypothetical protein
LIKAAPQVPVRGDQRYLAPGCRIKRKLAAELDELLVQLMSQADRPSPLPTVWRELFIVRLIAFANVFHVYCRPAANSEWNCSGIVGRKSLRISGVFEQKLREV